jgi:sulfatase maturation enzyme AslB (radical SAM superfamily)
VALEDDAPCGTTIVTYTDTVFTVTTTEDTVLTHGTGFAAGDVEPVVLRSVRAAREVEPVIVRCVQPLIVAANGDCWSCFGRHVVGNVLTDDWRTLVRKPRYQEWLRNRATGQALQDTWCRNCPRVM